MAAPVSCSSIFLPRYGINVTLCETTDHEALETAIGRRL